MSQTTIKLFRVVLACAFALTLSSIALADGTATITDGSPNQVKLRFDQFSTALSVTVNGTPQSNQEATISGPTYNWSIIGQTPSSPNFTITPYPDGTSATLSSASPYNGNFFVAGGGTYDITVKCVVTYISTDNQTQVQTPIPYRGIYDVTFFVRVPKLVVSIGRVNIPTPGPPVWGHKTGFALKIIDNQMPAEGYGYGKDREELSPAKLNPKFASDLQIQVPPPPGPAALPSGPEYLFQDQDNWDNDGWLAPYDTGNDTYWFDFYQTWHCMEKPPGYSDYTFDTTLNTHHITQTQGGATRTY